MFDRNENGLFEIEMDLNTEFRGKSSFAHSVLGDIRDTKSVENVLSKHEPQIIFHAAAHKHVPLMELNPLEAVKNNIFGTKNILDAASRHKVENFVMVSTDKAVNPTNIMGATKRIAELLTVSMNKNSSSRFTTVRFGNVLGSSGSVVSTFRKQLKRGGPLRVTHPEIKRYFMLIPEAVQLVLMAAASDSGGELFVLEMGEQIKIADLAENLIRLSGFIPHEEIKIIYSGLRPGEKLYEELFDDSENIITTAHEKLRIAVPDAVPSMDDLNTCISQLERIVSNNVIEELAPVIQSIVPK
jgi:FlaA1/EpsC-like NDP-sugar epimerase